MGGKKEKKNSRESAKEGNSAGAPSSGAATAPTAPVTSFPDPSVPPPLNGEQLQHVAQLYAFYCIKVPEKVPEAIKNVVKYASHPSTYNAMWDGLYKKYGVPTDPEIELMSLVTPPPLPELAAQSIPWIPPGGPPPVVPTEGTSTASADGPTTAAAGEDDQGAPGVPQQEATGDDYSNGGYEEETTYDADADADRPSGYGERGYGEEEEDHSTNEGVPATQDPAATTTPTRPATGLPEPEPESQRSRLLRFYLQYAPHKVGEVEGLLRQYRKDYESMWCFLTAQYGTEPPAPPINILKPNQCGREEKNKLKLTWKQRLRRFYDHYAPRVRDKEIDKMLRRCEYEGPHAYQQLWAALTARYGPEPVAPNSGLVRRYLPSAQEDEANPLLRGSAPSPTSRHRAAVHPRETVGGGAPLAEDTLPEDMVSGPSLLQRSASGSIDVKRDDDIGSVALGSLSPLSPATNDDHRNSSSTRRVRWSDTLSPGSHRKELADHYRGSSASSSPGYTPSRNAGLYGTGALEEGDDGLIAVQALLRLKGCSLSVYRDATQEKKLAFHYAIERDVSFNIATVRSAVTVTKITGTGSPSVEMELHLTPEQVEEGVADKLVTKVLLGTFTVGSTREAYRQLGGNAVQLFAEGAAIFGGNCTSHFQEGSPSRRELVDDEKPVLWPPTGSTHLLAAGSTSNGDLQRRTGSPEAHAPAGSSSRYGDSYRYLGETAEPAQQWMDRSAGGTATQQFRGEETRVPSPMKRWTTGTNARGAPPPLVDPPATHRGLNLVEASTIRDRPAWSDTARSKLAPPESPRGASDHLQVGEFSKANINGATTEEILKHRKEPTGSVVRHGRPLDRAAMGSRGVDEPTGLEQLLKEWGKLGRSDHGGEGEGVETAGNKKAQQQQPSFETAYDQPPDSFPPAATGGALTAIQHRELTAAVGPVTRSETNTVEPIAWNGRPNFFTALWDAGGTAAGGTAASVRKPLAPPTVADNPREGNWNTSGVRKQSIAAAQETTLPPQSVAAQMFRETHKPQLLNATPSTNNIPLSTGTAPPTFTVFPATSVETKAPEVALRHREDNRAAADIHVRELMRAIHGPREYLVQQGKTGPASLQAPPDCREAVATFSDPTSNKLRAQQALAEAAVPRAVPPASAYGASVVNPLPQQVSCLEAPVSSSSASHMAELYERERAALRPNPPKRDPSPYVLQPAVADTVTSSHASGVRQESDKRGDGAHTYTQAPSYSQAQQQVPVPSNADYLFDIVDALTV